MYGMSRISIYPQKGGDRMPQLTQMELNTLKELVAVEDVNAKKFQLYAENCRDSQLQSLMIQEAQQASSNVRTLMGFLKS
jgi:hypothetical protein